jgi:murein DD-endopeptidase MepM/ murein hydrolase activator NlpD
MSLLVALILIAHTGAQTNPPTFGGEMIIPKNPEPCLSQSAREALKVTIEENIEQLRIAGALQDIDPEGGHPLFDWPVGQAGGFDYNLNWSISNYIDHNPAYPNQITDYNCGTRSYDTNNGYNHQGYDIISWPFWWKQMERNQAVNLAAADGQIVAKQDGAFDMNCAFSNDPWNGIALQHSDGSLTYYLHMKSGALTTKGIGDSVTQGEFLGVIGSSGSSTIPHLHFETYDSATQLIDPNIGPCNNWNLDTWWNSQKPYLNPAINAVLTHSNTPVFPSCPGVEITYESDQFDLGDTVYYGLYLRDQMAGTSVHLKITKPDSSIFQEWDYTLTDNFQVSWWMWFYQVDMEGSWTWEATYQGDTVSHTFNVGQLGASENELTNTIVFPNPATSEMLIQSDHQIIEVSFVDLLGRTISEVKDMHGIFLLDVSSFSKGMYFVTLTSNMGKTKTINLIKN